MARRRVAARREVLPDPIYNSQLVTKFINGMMWGGKKSVAEEIFYGAMEKIAERTGEEPLKIFKKAVDTVAPTLEVKSRRIGGATHQGPLQVTKERRHTPAHPLVGSNSPQRRRKNKPEPFVGR